MKHALQNESFYNTCRNISIEYKKEMSAIKKLRLLRRQYELANAAFFIKDGIAMQCTLIHSHSDANVCDWNIMYPKENED